MRVAKEFGMTIRIIGGWGKEVAIRHFFSPPYQQSIRVILSASEGSPDPLTI